MQPQLRSLGFGIALALATSLVGAAPGDFDTTFASSGQLPNPYSANTAWSVAADGRLLAWETYPAASTTPRFRVTRRIANGQADGSWGTGGEAVVDTNAYVTAQGKSSCAGATAYGFRAAADGSATGSVSFTCTGTDFQLAVKLRANGLLDTGFGQGGFVDLNKTGLSGRFDIARISEPATDGSALAVMYSYDDYGEYVFALQRLRADGSAATAITDGLSYFAGGSPARTRLLADGHIIAAGGREVRRYSASGSADAAYGNGGTIDLSKTSAVGMSVIAAAGLSGDSADLRVDDAVISADGSVALAVLGTMTNVNQVLIARITPAGVLDSTFGSGGVAQLDTASAPWIGHTLDAWRPLQLSAAPTGELTLMGRVETHTTSIAFSKFTYLWRLTASGQPPTSTTLRGLQVLAEDLNDFSALGSLIGAQSGFDVLVAGYNTAFRLAGSTGTSPGLLTMTDSATANEGTVVQIPVMRVAGSDGALSVTYSTAAMNVFSAAAAGSDYTAAAGHVDWADGEAGVKYIPVTILADQVSEGDERFALNITGITGGAPMVGSGTQVVVVISANTVSPPPAPTPAPTSTPTSSAPASSSSGGGGGALDFWCLLSLLGAAAARRLLRG